MSAECGEQLRHQREADGRSSRSIRSYRRPNVDQEAEKGTLKYLLL